MTRFSQSPANRRCMGKVCLLGTVLGVAAIASPDNLISLVTRPSAAPALPPAPSVWHLTDVELLLQVPAVSSAPGRAAQIAEKSDALIADSSGTLGLSDLMDVRRRTRNPWYPPAEALPPALARDLLCSGVASGPIPVAFINGHPARPGDQVGGWKLEAVGPQMVFVSFRTFVVRLLVGQKVAIR